MILMSLDRFTKFGTSTVWLKVYKNLWVTKTFVSIDIIRCGLSCLLATSTSSHHSGDLKLGRWQQIWDKQTHFPQLFPGHFICYLTPPNLHYYNKKRLGEKNHPFCFQQKEEMLYEQTRVSCICLEMRPQLVMSRNIWVWRRIKFNTTLSKYVNIIYHGAETREYNLHFQMNSHWT